MHWKCRHKSSQNTLNSTDRNTPYTEETKNMIYPESIKIMAHLVKATLHQSNPSSFILVQLYVGNPQFWPFTAKSSGGAPDCTSRLYKDGFARHLHRTVQTDSNISFTKYPACAHSQRHLSTADESGIEQNKKNRRNSSSSLCNNSFTAFIISLVVCPLAEIWRMIFIPQIRKYCIRHQPVLIIA